MKIAIPNDVIEVDALRVGMFVHLDIGWMAHPFPLSSFRITSPAQVATIRSLGLKRVRWSPQQSDLSADAVRATPVAPPAGPLGTARVEAANDANGHVWRRLGDVGADPVDAGHADRANEAHGGGRAEADSAAFGADDHAADAGYGVGDARFETDADADETDTEPVAADLAEHHRGVATARRDVDPLAGLARGDVDPRPGTVGATHDDAGSGIAGTGRGDADALAVVADAAATSDVPTVEQRLVVDRRHARRRRALARQRAAESRCERQYAEAARDCRQTLDLVATRPQEARLRTEALARAVVDKMLGAPELCIRTITAGAGERASVHALNVGIVALLMGRCFGFGADDLLDVGVGALLHDVGKVELPLRLRHREDNFSANEERVYEEHVELGLVHARRMGLSAGAQAVIAQHHEHADGSGFPQRLNSDRMTMAGRIVALVDRYDSLCNPHLLAKALTPHESLSQLFAQGRSKFDTSILGAFIKMMGVYPPGSAVQLTDDRYALVTAVNSARPLKPKVIVHDAATPREEALVVDLETVPGLGIRRSVKPSRLPAPAFDYLAPNPHVAYFFEPVSVADEQDDDVPCEATLAT